MEELNQDSTNITKKGKFLIAGIATLQGLLLYLLHYYIKNDLPILEAYSWRTMLYTAALIGPTILMLSIRNIKDKAPWYFATAYTLIFSLVSFYTSAQCEESYSLRCGTSIFLPLIVCQTIALFIALFFLQTWLDNKKFIFPYSKLFNFSWLNFLSMILAAIFYNIFQSVLWLWALLFKSVGIDIFYDLFFSELWFKYICGGFIFGVGIVIFRNEMNFVYAVRKILQALMRTFLPLLSFISLIFLLTLIFTGLEPLWDTGYATYIMMWLIALMLFLINAVYQDGNDHPPYSRKLSIFIQTTLIVFPIYGLLCAYSLYLRVGQHGWSNDRLWAAIIILLMSGYIFSYAYSILIKRENWTSLFRPINTSMSIIILIVCFVSQTPILDLKEITIQSQLSRLDSGKVDAKDFDYKYFRFDLGKTGYLALQKLKSNPMVIKAEMSSEIDNILENKNHYRNHTPPKFKIENVKMIPADLSPPKQFLDLLDNEYSVKTGCKNLCYLIKLDMNADGAPEYILLSAGPGYGWGFVYRKENNIWEKFAEIKSIKPWKNALVIKSLETEDVNAVIPEWNNLQIGKTIMDIKPLGK